MKLHTLIVGLFLFSASSFADGFGFLADCTRSDGGEAPVVTIYANDYAEKVILNDGSREGWGDKSFEITVELKGPNYKISGAIDTIISSIKEKQSVIISFDPMNKSLTKWLKANTDLPIEKKTRYSFNCKADIE